MMVVMSIKTSDDGVIRGGNENGNCSRNRFPVRQVKWKRRNVSAVRDYPPGCGPVLIVPEVLSPVGGDRVVGDGGNGEPVGSGVENPVLIVPEVLSPVGGDRVVGDGGNGGNGEPVGSGVENLVSNGVENGEVRADNGVNNEVQNGDVKVDNGGGGGVVKGGRPMKFKPRKVCAVRDFPPFCGPNASVPTEEERRRINGRMNVGTESNGNVKGDLGRNTVSNESNEGSIATQQMKMMVELKTDVEERKIKKAESSKKVQNIGQACQELVVYTRDKDLKKVSPVNVAHDVGSEEDVRDITPLSRIQKGIIVKNREAGSEKHVKKRPLDDTKITRDKDLKKVSPVNVAHDVGSEEDVRDITPLSQIQKGIIVKNREAGSEKPVKKRPLDDTKIKVVMGLKAPSLRSPGIQENVLTNEAKGRASITPKKNKEKVVGESSSTGRLETVEKDLTSKGKGDASMTPKQSTKKKPKKNTLAGSLAMVVKNEEDSVADIEEKYLTDKGKGDASMTPKQYMKKKPKNDTVASTLAMVVRNEEDSVADIEEKYLTDEGKGDASVTPKKSMKKTQKQVSIPSTLAMIVSSEEDLMADLEEKEGIHDVDVSLPPFGPKSSNDARNKVRQTLRLFHGLCRKILQGDEARTDGAKVPKRRVDLAAKSIMDRRGRTPILGVKTYGPVPGVEVGDEFQYRVELALVGIHRPFQAGIDYVKKGNEFFAVSVVASGGYKNEIDRPDCLMYSGAGGVGKDKSLENQKLERGNLALKNNVDLKYPVRVIRGYKVKADDSSDSKSKMLATYIYDGLYTVADWKQEPGPKGNMVFQFELQRIPGQPQLAKREVMSKKFKIREGVCVKDISNGKEAFPVCAINTIDDEKPPEFTYITKIMYPDWYKPVPPKGCDCVGRCTGKKCACAIKNGGEIRYNRNGAIVEAKPLVFECGPSCRCPPSCYNRVTQHGMKINLEIFKTETRGWGVRSLSSIASGSFICEYIGELLEDKEAEERKGSDEYLFDIGQNYNDCSFSDTKSEEIVDTGGGFTIDAKNYGNVGRFINHSCSPNLYAQNVLYDQDDIRMPHIMLFAAENIPPLTELTYHYNYAVDEVIDANGNIKVKHCYCGSSECTGRLY